jgi:hypothetical protein
VDLGRGQTQLKGNTYNECAMETAHCLTNMINRLYSCVVGYFAYNDQMKNNLTFAVLGTLKKFKTSV